MRRLFMTLWRCGITKPKELAAILAIQVCALSGCKNANDNLLPTEIKQHEGNGVAQTSKSIALNSAKLFLREYARHDPGLTEDLSKFLAQPDIRFDKNKNQWWVWFSNELPGNSICVILDESANKGTVVGLSAAVITSDQSVANPDDPPLFTISEFRNALLENNGK
jgi:hypothetical protein